MSVKRVAIIGGGLAGLATAVFLKNSDRGNEFDIMLYESSPKLGGRTYSFFDNNTNLFFDNGQHILAGWYENTFKYLNIIGSNGLLDIQKGLEINFINKEKQNFRLKAPQIIAPLNMIIALWRYKAIGFMDKLRLKNILKLINVEKFNDELLLSMNAEELLSKLKQSKRIREYFWEPFIYAVFNTRAENVSAKMLVEVLKRGFSKVNSSNLIIPKTDLGKLFIEPAEKFFKENNVRIKYSSRVNEVLIENNTATLLRTENGGEENFDMIVSAVPFFAFRKMFDEKMFNDNFPDSDRLRPSSITSVHLFFEEDIPEEMLQDNSFGMTGLIRTKVQWIFKRSNRHLSLVISGSDFLNIDDETSITDAEKEELLKMINDELSSCLNGIEKLKLNSSKIIKEKRATFIPDKRSYSIRPDTECKIKNLYIAGDWTNTGLPATIESAITSAKKVTNKILNSN